MNKYLLIGGVVVLAGVGGWVYFNQTPASSPATESTNTAQNTNTQQPAQKSSTVEKISWHTEMANPNLTDSNDYKKYEQLISIDVTFADKSTKRYSLGKEYGCDEANIARSPELGRMRCNFADSGPDFVASMQGGKFVVERQDVSAKDGSIKTTVVLEI